MSVKALKPITPGQRGRVVNGFDAITTDKPEKSLLSTKKRTGGRNSQGKMTMKFIGGGHKKRYRIIDFKRDKSDIPGKVMTIEYDPNRSAYISLINYADGDKRYILSPVGLKVNDYIVAGEKVPLKNGNAMQLVNIPTGLFVHNIELVPGRGGQVVRSAGTSAQVMAHDGGYTTLKLPSGEIRMVKHSCKATIGQIGNRTHEQVVSGKAGRSRWLGRRPSVRGVAMNPVDHPMGGGEGKSSGGRHPCTPWEIGRAHV